MIISKNNSAIFLLFLAIFPTPIYSWMLSIIGIKISITLIQFFIFAVYLFFIQKMSINLNYSKLFIFLLIFISYSLLSSFYFTTEDIGYNTIKMISMIVVLINILFLTIAQLNRKEIIKILYYLNIYFIVLSLLALLFPSYTAERLSSFGINPIWLSRYAILGFIFLLVKAAYNNKVSLLLLIGSFITLLCAYKTGSRGPFVALFFTFIYMYYLINKYHRKVLFITILSRAKYFFILLMLLAFYWIWNQITSDTSVSFYYRKEMILNIFELDNLSLFGLGLGNYYKIGGYSEIFNYPHNVLIETIVELGIIGFALIIFIYNNFTKVNKTFDYYGVLLNTLFFNTIVNAMFSGDLGTRNIYIYLFIILLLKYNKPLNSKRLA